MVRLEEINGNNVWDILKLKVGENQKDFVAPNDVSIIEAYIAVTHHGKAFPFGIYDGDTPVGFCMIGFGTDDDWEDAPAVAKDSYNLWRFMIDERYQGKGYGREAMKLILDYIGGEPCGPAEYCWLSYEPENEGAKALYASFGFRETGEFDGDEAIAVLELWPDHTAEEMKAEFEALLSDDEAVVFLYRKEGEVIGFAQCQLRHDYVEGTESSPVGYLEGIYVKEADRRQGISGILLKACEEWAKEQGCTEFASDCEAANAVSQRFHEAAGFVETNRIVTYVRKL